MENHTQNKRRNYKKGRNYKNTSETNSKKIANPSHEFNSYGNSVATSYRYFGLNIFDYFSQEELDDIIKDPINNNEILRKMSLMLYGSSGAVTNTIDYMTALPSLQHIAIPYGESKTKKKKNKMLMEKTLKAIRHKDVIRDFLFKGMVEGTAFAYFESNERPYSKQKYMSDFEVDRIVEINKDNIPEFNASIINLPTDFTKIVGMKNSSYVIAFNLDYFNIGDAEPAENKLRKYPKEIRDAYEKKKNSNTTGNWVILDNNKTIVHKIRSKREEKWGRPMVLAAISDILLAENYNKTQNNTLNEINNKVVYQTFPQGERKGLSALTEKQQKQQHEAVKSAVTSKNNRNGISFFSVAAGTKLDKISLADSTLLDTSYTTNLQNQIALDLGLAASLLNGVSQGGSFGAQQSNLELVTAQLFCWIESITEELNKCINANIIKDKNNYCEVEYLKITNANRSEMVGYCKDLYLSARGSVSLWSAAVGISPNALFAILDQELEDGIEEKYPVHLTSYTSTGDNNGGRPTTETPTDSTIATRESRNANE